MGFWSRALSAFGIVVTPSVPGGPAPAYGTPAGVTVSADNSMRVSAFFACARLIASSIGGLPLPLYERSEGVTARSEARQHPLWSVLVESPNADQTPLDYWENAALSLMLAGDHIAIKHQSGGRVIALEPVSPLAVQIDRDEGTRAKRYRIGSEVLGEDDVFHIMGFGGGPLRGMSVLGQARDTLGLTIGSARAASSLFRQGLRPSGVIELSDWMKDEAQAARVSERLAREFAGAENAGRAMVLEGGMTWKALSMNAEDAQLLETRKFSVDEICRFFGVPPFMIGHTEKSSSWGTGMEQQLLMFQKFTLTPWLRRIEQAVRRQLLNAPERGRYFAEFNMEGLLRADSQGRAAFYRSMTSIGAMTINEVRQRENLPAIAGGDVPRLQQQNVPLTAIAATE